MADIELKLNKKLFTPKFYPYLLDYSHRWEFWMGSAGSSKSYTITQKLIIRACSEQIKILVCRRYGTTIRNTVFATFKEILGKWKLTPYVKVRETDFNIKFPNGSEIIFLGLDDEAKLLSLNNIGTIFIEEAYEVPQNMVEQLNLRMRGNVANQQLILAWNPISKSSWLYDFSVGNPPANSIFIHSTYKDNPFLSAEYISALEELYTRNPQKARVFCDGEWGVDSSGLVFQNFKVEEFNPQELAASGLEHRCGADFGFVDPSTIVASLYDKKNGKIYVYNEFYKRGCQLDTLYEAMVEMQLTKTKIYMDSSEPRSIDFFKRKGINAQPCIKGAGSVNSRIAFLQNHQIIIHPSCKNVLMEFENFAYERTKDGQLKESYTHEYSHAIDGLGYAYSDIYTKSGLRTMNKAVLGL